MSTPFRLSTLRKLTAACTLAGLAATLHFPASAAPAQAPRQVVVGGTGAALGVMAELGQAFAAAHPGVQVKVVPSLGSSGGLKALGAGALDVAVTSRALTPDENARGLKGRPIIQTPFIFAVPLKNTVAGTTLDEIADMYAGKQTKWPDGTLIRTILRPLSDVDTQLLRDLTPAFGQAVPIAHQLPGKNIAITDTDTADELERVPGSIGTSTLLLVAAEKRALKGLALDSVEPTVDNMKRGKYQLSKIIFLALQSAPTAEAKSFADFISSPAAAELIRNSGGLQLAETP